MGEYHSPKAANACLKREHLARNLLKRENDAWIDSNYLNVCK